MTECWQDWSLEPRPVLASFGPITTGNRRIIVQEWLAEAFTMWALPH